MDIQLNQIIFQIINFGIVFAVLVKFLFNPIQNILEQRASKIEEGLNAAEKNIKAQDEMEAKEKKVIQTARKKADGITKEAKEKAEQKADEIITKAKKDAKAVIDKERESMMASIEAERQQLQETVTDLVTQTTSAMLQKYLGEKEHQAILDKQIKDLKSIKLSA